MEQSNMSFGEVVKETDRDDQLALTRQVLPHNGNATQVLVNYRKVFGQLGANLGCVTMDNRVIFPKELEFAYLQTSHGNHVDTGKMLEEAKVC